MIGLLQAMRTRQFCLSALVLAVSGGVALSGRQAPAVRPVASHATAASAADLDSAQQTIAQSCVGCHSDRAKAGGLSFERYAVAGAGDQLEVTEKMIRKLRAGQMPPAGSRRPADSVLDALAGVLEAQADAHAVDAAPGRRTFQRLNRAEYTQSVRDLLGLDINAGDYLPLDTKSANFDNIADAQLLSPTVMQGYLTAAAEISRLAVGDPDATAREATYPVSRWTSQREQVEGAPFGTRGGLAVTHTFPADGQYRFRVSFYHETTGALYGNGRAALHTAEAPEQVEIAIDGERVALLDVDRWMNSSDPDGVNLRTEPIAITAGPHTVSAAFVARFEGPVQDLITPLEWSIASTSIADAYGFTTLPHLRDMAITGPFETTGVSETPSRRKVFACRPQSAAQQTQCAHTIVTALASQAFRRTATERDVNALMALYREGAAAGGFEAGVRMALEGILASPRFVFRFEERPASARDGKAYQVSDVDLASRLSFFLWASAPDAELLRIAEAGRLSRPGEVERQVTPDARRPPGRRAGLALRGAVAAAAGSRQDQPRRPLLSRLRRAAEGVDAARDRDVLPARRPQRPAGARSLHRRLHLRGRAAGQALPDPGHRRQRNAPCELSRYQPPRSARPRQHPHTHLARPSGPRRCCAANG